MAEKSAITIAGSAELRKALEALDTKALGAMMGRATAKAVKPIQSEAKRRARQLGGDVGRIIANSIRVKHVRRRDGSAMSITGPTSPKSGGGADAT